MDSTELKCEIVRRGIRQQDVARQIGLNPSAFSLMLSGRRTPPTDFKSRVLTALDMLEQADQAAEEARWRVLAS